ncbi:MAG: pyroglutamyl-peptidase I [Xanthobacteraceae bacterium]|nr:pyroglutamyl-peptidase I [Xanthobacteraceae bacterium]
MTRILITGFEAFPGAPYNPTPKLVERLLRLRRPALADVTRIGHIFRVTYQAVDRQLPELIAKHHPDALLMFGLATRTPFLRVETRARNTVTQIFPDASHAPVRSRTLELGAESTRRFGPHIAQLLRAARGTGIDARLSLSAGFYLCNYLSWRAIEATRRHDSDPKGRASAKWEPVFGENHAAKKGGPRLAAFIHVPLVPRDAAHHRKQGAVTFEQMVDAGEAVMMRMVGTVRQIHYSTNRSLALEVQDAPKHSVSIF